MDPNYTHSHVIGWLIEWLIGWLIEWLIAWMIDWLIDWLMYVGPGFVSGIGRGSVLTGQVLIKENNSEAAGGDQKQAKQGRFGPG